jgi:hypothetical protein
MSGGVSAGRDDGERSNHEPLLDRTGPFRSYKPDTRRECVPVPPMVVTEFIEEPPFQLAFARLARLGPLMDTALRAHIASMKAELTEHGAQPPGAVPHPDRDGSRIVVRAGLRLRYFVTKPRRQS